MTGPVANTNTGIAAGETARLPDAGPLEALKHLHSQLTPETLKALSPEMKTAFLAELKRCEALIATSISESKIGPLRNQFDSEAISLTLKDQLVRVAIPDATVTHSRSKMCRVLEEIGGRAASLKEIEAVLEYLVAREKIGKLKSKESTILRVLRTKGVRAKPEGRCIVEDNQVRMLPCRWPIAELPVGSLVVCSSAESK